MEKETYKNDVLVAVTLLLCLWFKLDIKGVFKSEIFDTISWLAFFMPIICIEKYSTYFACASWVFGDIILLSAFLLIRNKYKIKIG